MKPALKLYQQGLTLIELLVAMVLMLLVAIATVALFNVSSSSYRTVDAGQELQDNARFAMEVLGQAARSAGFQDRTGPTVDGQNYTDSVFGPVAPIKAWRVEGANNAKIDQPAQLKADIPAAPYGSNNGYNQSDVLVIRFFGATSPTDPSKPDGSMIDCSGRRIPYPSGSADLGISAFSVDIVAGEPELQCTSYNPDGGAISTTSIVRGVESFQVMFGLDTNGDDIPDRWVSADPSWNSTTAIPNWNNVVAVRVGVVLRGPPGSGQGKSATASENDLYPLGKAFVGDSTESGMKLTPTDDGRLRRSFATTFTFRNAVR